MSDAVTEAVRSLDASPSDVDVLFTAHSIPLSMADHCDYQKQLLEASRLVAHAAGTPNWRLVYQSRSGPPQQPWLEPDVCDAIVEMDEAKKVASLVIVPIGFVSDHMEVMFDLDEEAAAICKQRGIAMARSATAGTSPKFVEMIRKLVQERISGSGQREAVGDLGPWHDVCPADCCLYTPRRPAATS
jgi:ferrochelatase